MNWIFDHFEVLAVVLLALASWLKARFDARKRTEEEEATPFDPEDEWRQPPALPPSQPPPVWQQPRPKPPPLAPARPVYQEPAGQQDVLRKQQEIQERLREIREQRKPLDAARTAAAAQLRNGKRRKKEAPVQPVRTHVSSLLRQRQDLRRAILLREILGPPVGMRREG